MRCGGGFTPTMRACVRACVHMRAHAATRRDAAAVTLLHTAGLNQRLQGWFEEGDAVEDVAT